MPFFEGSCTKFELNFCGRKLKQSVIGIVSKSEKLLIVATMNTTILNEITTQNGYSSYRVLFSFNILTPKRTVNHPKFYYRKKNGHKLRNTWTVAHGGNAVRQPWVWGSPFSHNILGKFHVLQESASIHQLTLKKHSVFVLFPTPDKQ